MQIPILLFILSIYITKVISECPNACSGHGTCGAYDMCLCYRNWMANDCSERICQFGLAFADTPKGDLDASGDALTGPDEKVVVNSFMYPFGTTEQFPSMTDSEGSILTNSAHYYSECSNAGICDRASGTCDCFEGYEGSACQRASCPSNSDGICSGHGVCKTIREIAADDEDNVYRLWDMDSSLGCVCDGGYSGADCSERVCKYGADPLYSNNHQTIRYSNYTYQIYTESVNSKVYGNYSLVFYDAFGEDWQTEAISIQATCNDVTAALEALPNSVIPNNSVLCYNKGSLYTDDEITSLSGSIFIQNRFTIAFSGNPGRLEQIDINIYLDGNRPTLYTDETTSTLGYHIYPNGFQGEYTDYVSTLCEDVYVTLSSGTTYDSLTALNDYQTKLLKKCLGDSDGSSSNNVEVYNWDYGSAYNPHLIKLVDATGDNYTTLSFYEITDSTQIGYPVTRLCSTSNNVIQGYGSLLGAGWCPNYKPAGFYVVLFYDSFTSLFKILTRPSHDYATTTKFHVFTTTGWLQIVNPQSAAFTVPLALSTTQKIDPSHSNILYLTNLTNSYFEFYGQLDCLSTTIGVNGALDCLNKNDFVMVLNSNVSLNGHASNPIYPNLYQVAKVYKDEPITSDTSPTNKYLEYKVTLDYNLNAIYSFATGYQIGGLDSKPYKYEYSTAASIYKFHLPTDNSEYTYTAQCSNRGLCDKSTGVCDCFNGFTNDNCDRQNALAI